jgi:hypothetical protein
VTEDKPERDPLEELREMRAGLIDECSCVYSRTCVPWDWWGLFDRAIAAWTQEREKIAKLEAERSSLLTGEWAAHIAKLEAENSRLRQTNAGLQWEIAQLEAGRR